MKDSSFKLRFVLFEQRGNLCRTIRISTSIHYTHFTPDIIEQITTPHLGACTPESEEKCSVMAAQEIYDYRLSAAPRCTASQSVSPASALEAQVSITTVAAWSAR